MTAAKLIHLVPVASGIAAQDQGCADGPAVLKQSAFLSEIKSSGLYFLWHQAIVPDQTQPTLVAVAEVCTKVAKITQKVIEKNQFFIAMGGDHSMAIGTWSGVSVAKSTQGPIGLLWIDAHIDGHTPETTPSGAIHGMPVAALLGHGHQKLVRLLQPTTKIDPKHLVLIGIRSCEAEEEALAKALGVRIYYMNEVHQRGLKVVMKEALHQIKQQTLGYGITIDLDAIDPRDAPGVGSPVEGGIFAEDLQAALALVKGDEALFGLEIAEFNPHRDRDHLTEKTIAQLIQAVVGK